MGNVVAGSGQTLGGAGTKRPRMIASWGAGLLLLLASCAFAQSIPTGELSGKLTDLHSHAVEGATLILRNASTGAEVHATTSRNGAYRFTSLAPGEYTLQANSPQLGQGRVAGIYIAAGHESRVQTALALNREPPEPAPGPVQIRSSHDAAPSAVVPLAAFTSRGPPILSTPAEKPFVLLRPIESALSTQPTAALPLHSRSISPPEAPALPVLRSSPGPTIEAAKLTPPIAILPTQPAAIAALPLPSTAAIAVTRASAPSGPSPSADPSSVLSGQNLQALPLSGRSWEDFVLDSPASASSDDDDDRESAQSAPSDVSSVSVDNASTKLAFGGRGAGSLRHSRLMGPGGNDAAVAEVRPYQNAGDAAGPDSAHNTTVESPIGTVQFHGQAFLFDRRNLLGARNPFTQWVKETAPGTLTTTPVFTPFPYTAPHHEDRWGFGVGSRLKRPGIFWFAAYDGSRHNDPGVASVRHPDSFFAQPSNDEMQVLSARLGLSSTSPVSEGLAAYSSILESLAGLLGPAPRAAAQSVAFGRVDWRAGERHRFTLEGTGASWNSPGGGFTRVSEIYGNHSFGTSRAREFWMMGRWEAFLTSNLLAVLQGSAARHIFSEAPETPSPFERSLNVNAWRQLPQIAIDPRYGFTIGNPSRFGNGAYPDEHLYQLQPGVHWIRGDFLVKAGADWRHNTDATSMVRNHTGTYHYSTLEDFASDALVFAKYGISGALDRFDQHNCDTRGRAWRDREGQLNGLGYLPCYSYYSQVMGPTDWHLGTNDLAAFVTAQWQPAKRFVMSAALRWEREYFPPPIPLVDNPALPRTREIPSPGNQWGPRFSMAWGAGENRWPVLRAGYGMYFGRTQNSVLQAALTQTGSFKGDLYLFMRPTDNLTGGGAPPFPYVLAGAPATVVKPGAVEFAPSFKNPEIHQGEVTVQERLPGRVQLSASALVSLARRLPVTIDTNFDPAANPGTITYAVNDALSAGPIKARQFTVPFFASWPDSDSPTGSAGRLNANYQQITQLVGRANSTYEAAMLRLSRFGRRGISFHGRYTYAHAMDWNPNESALISGSSVLDPLDFRQEYGTSSLDIRHSASGMLIWNAPWKLAGAEGRFANGWMLSGIGQFHSGLPYTMRTAGPIPTEFDIAGAPIVGLGASMNGYGGDNRVYGVGRNTYRYPFTWKADVRLGKKFDLGRMRELELLAESFNLFNHQNVTRLETVGYYIAPGNEYGSLPTLNFLTGLKSGQTQFGKPLDVNATTFFRPRQFDFGMRMRF